MSRPATVLVAITCLGVLWPASTPVSAQKRCANEEAGFDAAKAPFQDATRAVLALEDQIELQQERITAIVHAITEAAPAEAQAKKAWQAAVDRYTYCLNAQRYNGCAAEKRAMEAATDKLNAAAAPRWDFENRLKTAFEELANLQDQLKTAKDKWGAARDELDKARTKLDKCRCKKWKGGWHCTVAWTYEECCVDKDENP